MYVADVLICGCKYYNIGTGGEYPPMLPRDVTDNAAMFPMVNQIYKEFQVRASPSTKFMPRYQVKTVNFSELWYFVN